MVISLNIFFYPFSVLSISDPTPLLLFTTAIQQQLNIRLEG